MVVLKMTSGKEFTLKNILYVPEICKNLVFGSLLGKDGFHMVFELDKMVLTKAKMCVGKGYLIDRLFTLYVMIVVSKMNKNAISSAYLFESSNLWHGVSTTAEKG